MTPRGPESQLYLRSGEFYGSCGRLRGETREVDRLPGHRHPGVATPNMVTPAAQRTQPAVPYSRFFAVDAKPTCRTGIPVGED